LQRLLRYLGRRLRPFLRPDWEDEQRTLGRITSRLEQLAQIEAVTSRHASELAQLRERFDGLARRDLMQARKGLGELRRAVLSQVQATNKALRQAEFFDQQSMHEQALQRVIDRARRSGRPLLAGPWTGEIGFELLYWIPFLRKLKARAPDLPISVISRGGVAAWYDGIATSYQDILATIQPAEFRDRTEGETRKQRSVGRFDRQLLREASRSFDRRPVIVHPSLMYHLLYPYWKDALPLRRLFEYLEPARLEAEPASGVSLDVPDDYVAVRFYFSQSFPDNASNRQLVQDVLQALSKRVAVVLLTTPFAVDDHVDAAPELASVRSIGHLLTPENNLAVQTAVIRRARAFVGTYGGFSYLAPLYGVPSVTFYSDATFFEQHLEFARRTFSRVAAAPFVVLHERERALLGDLVRPAP
jgi:hypothetical protein